MKNIVLIVVMLFACLNVSAQQATEFSAETSVATTESYGTADDSLLRVSKGRLYLGTERLDRKELQSLFVSEPNLYFRYKDALRWRKLSWTPFVASLVPALALWTYGGLAGPEDGSIVLELGRICVELRYVCLVGAFHMHGFGAICPGYSPGLPHSPLRDKRGVRQGQSDL